MRVRGSAAIIVSLVASAAILGQVLESVDAFKTNVAQRVPCKAEQFCDRQLLPLCNNYIIESSIELARVGTAREKTLLFMSRGSDEKPTESSPLNPFPSINIPLITRNLANQALIGYQIWTGGSGFAVLSEETHFGTGALILGILGVIPMLALSRAIETSESPLVLGLNLSTNMAVLRLFGPTSQPILAFFASLLMAASTGIVEETIFRGQCEFRFSTLIGLSADFFPNDDQRLIMSSFLQLCPFLLLPTVMGIF